MKKISALFAALAACPVLAGPVSQPVAPVGTGSRQMTERPVDPRITPTDGILARMIADGAQVEGNIVRPAGTNSNAVGQKAPAKALTPAQMPGLGAGAIEQGKGSERGGDPGKYEQPIECGNTFCGAFFSNVGFDWRSIWNPFLRVEDFTCTLTGDITTVSWTGSCWDFSTFTGCDFPGSNVTSFVVEIYRLDPNGVCCFQPGEFLCGYRFPSDALITQFECPGLFSEIYYRFTAFLPVPCFQERGQRYALFIAGVPADPNNPQGFAWATTTFETDCPGYSTDAGDFGIFDICTGCDNVFALNTVPGPCDGKSDPRAKWSQPGNCDNFCYFSNVNSNLNPFERCDDFVCTLSGPIEFVNIWGSCWDLGLGGCPLPGSNVRALNIEIFEFAEDPVCGWRPGNRICDKTIRIEEMNPQFECVGPGGEQYYKLTADLRVGSPCCQEQGKHYVIRVRGVLGDPNGNQIFCWAQTCSEFTALCPAYSRDRNTGECLAFFEDNAFELFTPAPQGAQDPDCSALTGFCCFFSTENDNNNGFLKYDDFVATGNNSVNSLTFYFGAYDIFNFFGIDILSSNLQTIRVEISENSPGVCGCIGAGEIIYSRDFRLAELNPTFFCSDPCGVPHYEMSTTFGAGEVPVVGGQTYVLKVSAITNDPNSGQLGCWLVATSNQNCNGYSDDQRIAFITECNMDQAFTVGQSGGPCDGCPDCDGDGVCDVDETDCDNDGIPRDCEDECEADLAPPFGVLNVFDFLAFQTAFGNGDPCADLAPPFGVLNVFDFLAFQTAFGNGC